MSLTYVQKRSILDFLSQPKHWENFFNMEFYTDEKRKWKSNVVKDISVSNNSNATRIDVYHTSSGASVLFERENDVILIEDESHRKFVVGREGITGDSNCQAHIVPAIGSQKIDLENKVVSSLEVSPMDAYVRFEPSGEKTIYIGGNEDAIHCAAPQDDVVRKIYSSRFLHAISFDHDAIAQYGMPEYSFMNSVKIIVAKEMGVEPSIKALNKLNPWAFAAYLDYRMEKGWSSSGKEGKFDTSQLEEAWKDSTDFEGYFVDAPKMFSVQMTKDGFDVLFSLDHRERIWSQTRVLQHAFEKALTPVDVISDTIKAKNLVHILNKGAEVQDHRGRDWNCVVLSKNIGEHVRDTMQRQWGLSGDHASAINYGENRCLVAMDSEELERVGSDLDTLSSEEIVEKRLSSLNL